MKNPFQAINRVIQSATSSARAFIEGNSGDFTSDDLDEWLSFSFAEEGLGEEFRELYDEVVKLATGTYLELTNDNEED